jgi:ribonuclease HI
MGRVYTDSQKIVRAMQSNPSESARRFRDLGNENRNPVEKQAFWKESRRRQKISDSD